MPTQMFVDFLQDQVSVLKESLQRERIKNMSLTERIRRIASDVDEAGPADPTLRSDFDAFKNEVTQQFDDLRKDLQTLLEASQHEQQQSGN